MPNAFVAHGGGPTAVLNSSLHGIVDACRSRGVKRLFAAIGGLSTMPRVRTVDLLPVSASRIARAAEQPGSAIASYRGVITRDDLARFVEFCRRHDIRYCFYTGGQGSMATARRILDEAKTQGYELMTVGVPKTIDNDLCGTDHCPGFGSAARFVAQSVWDIGLDQRALPSPVSIIEVMGRNTGWLAASSILARYAPDAPPHFIYVPERPFDTQAFLHRLDDLLVSRGWAVGVVAEGLRDLKGQMIGAGVGSNRDAKGRPLAGNTATVLAKLASRRLKVRVRSEKPGLLCRAASLLRSEVDAREAYAAGKFAVQAALKGASDAMVGLRREPSSRYRCTFELVPLHQVADHERALDPIHLEGDTVGDSFRQYAAPLTGAKWKAPVIF